MKRGIFLCAVSFFTYAVLSGSSPVFLLPARTSTSGTRAAAQVASSSSGDVWVYNGGWCYWDGAGFCDSTDLGELERRFLDESSYLKNARPLNDSQTISFLTERRDIYVLDSTPLFFGETPLTVGGLFGFCELSIMSGTINADSIQAAADVFIGPDCTVAVAGGIIAGCAFECFGGTVSATDISARKLWFDSSEAPLSVTVSGCVMTGYYTQSGGSVTIGEGLFAFVPDTDGRGGVTVNNDFAYHNATVLQTDGDIICAGDGGSIEVCGGSTAGGMDEAGFTSFISLRSDKKSRAFSVYDEISPDIQPSDNVTVNAGGNIKATCSITIHGGVTSAGGVIYTQNDGGAVRVHGGEVYQNVNSPQ